MDELILKYLEKQINPTEEIMVKRWLEDSDNNQYYFQVFSKAGRSAAYQAVNSFSTVLL